MVRLLNTCLSIHYIHGLIVLKRYISKETIRLKNNKCRLNVGGGVDETNVVAALFTGEGAAAPLVPPVGFTQPLPHTASGGCVTLPAFYTAPGVAQ
jgi:hypothetical protein